jgi:uncharacterized membrane protein YfhO
MKHKFGSHAATLLDRNKKKYLLVFSLSLVTALFIILPSIIMNKGYFLLYGDFNVQQYPFYMHMHDAIRSGAIGWDFKTDLGANFLGSYSFYNVASPFFLFTLIFPAKAVPYLIGPLLALKISFCAVTGYAYISRFVRDQGIAMLGGLMYAFSGFSLFNIFFNHFHESMLFFPLLLIAIEEIMDSDRKGLLIPVVFINVAVNYFFFFGAVIFVIIYFFVRLFSGAWKISFSKFFTIGFEAVTGLLLAGFILFPSIEAALQNPRTDSMLYGWNAILYSQPQRYLNIIESFFFPPDLPARPNFTPDSDAKWGSIAAYLPLFGMAGVIAFIKSREGHWLKKLIVILFFIAFVPILNSAFVMFTANYYARWYYMFTLMTALATCLAIGGKRIRWKSGFMWAGGITLAIAATIAFTPKTKNDDGSYEYGLMAYKGRFWAYVAIAAVFFILAVLVIRLLRKKRRRIFSLSLAAVSLLGVSAVLWIYFITVGNFLSYSNSDYVVPYAIEGKENIDMPEGEKEAAQDGQFRIDVYSGMDNLGLFWGMSSINFFHSIVPYSVMDFYPQVGIQRGVATRPETNHYAIRSLLSVKYLFGAAENSPFGKTTPIEGENEYGETWGFTDPDGYPVIVTPDSEDAALGDFVPNENQFIAGDRYETLMPGYSYVSTSNGFDLWKNDYYIPMGFTYDEYITNEQFLSVSSYNRANMLISAMVLSEEQAERYSDILQPIILDESILTQEAYFRDCKLRASTAASEYLPDNGGFTSKISLNRDNLVFFSVPYDSGWTATVNGKPVPVENVNVGFMAVLCKAGENEIRFTYKTPWLREGVIVSLVSLTVFLLYILLFVRPKFLRRLMSPAWSAIDAVLSKRPFESLGESEEYDRYYEEYGGDREEYEVFDDTDGITGGEYEEYEESGEYEQEDTEEQKFEFEFEQDDADDTQN